MKETQEVIKAEVIWDREHGKANQGWYVRLHVEDEDGYTETFDSAFHARRDIGLGRAKTEARAAAASFGFWMPRGVDVEFGK